MADRVSAGNTNINELLARALQDGDLRHIRTLIDAGADVRARRPCGFPIMRYASSEEVIALLVQNGADLNLKYADGTTWLHTAALNDLEQVRILLRHGANPDSRGRRDKTPLFCALLTRRTDIVETLISAGARVNLHTQDGSTPLHQAILGGCYESAVVLLRHNADVNAREEKGNTPLHLAVNMHGVWENDTTGLLLEYGADIHAATFQRGLQPIHCAAFHGHDVLILRLVEAGADINAESGIGRPLGIAARRGHTRLVRVLRDLGAVERPGGDGFNS